MFLKVSQILKEFSSLQLLFLAWLFSIPFGSKIFHFSIGFATLYPSLILGGVLFIVTFKSFIKSTKLEKIIGFIFVLFLIQAIIQYFFIKGKKEGLFDIHSIILFTLYYFNFILTKHTFPNDRFIYLINKGIRFFAYFILIFGIIETLLGIHIVGDYTYKLQNGIATDFYSPLFIYDNPNDFLVYSIGSSLLMFLYDQKQLENKLLTFSILVLNLFFAHISMSRFAILFLEILLLIYIWKYFIVKLTFSKVLLFFIPLSLLIFSNKTYWGPIIITQLEKLKEQDKVEESTQAKPTVKVEKKKESIETSVKKLDSFTLRKNLVLNGISFYKQSPIFGIGPGQFRYSLNKKNHPYLPIDKNSSPHNYFIELISQYGILGIILFFVPFVLFIKKIYSRKWNFLFSILVFLYYLEGLMPSAFLYLDMNWILFTSIVLCYSEDFVTFKTFRYVGVS